MHENAARSLPEIIIREMTAADASDAAALSAELGYPVAIEAMENRLKQLPSRRITLCLRPAGKVMWSPGSMSAAFCRILSNCFCESRARKLGSV
jgi:hypothetical protein